MTIKDNMFFPNFSPYQYPIFQVEFAAKLENEFLPHVEKIV